jgi:uncharacterized protein
MHRAATVDTQRFLADAMRNRTNRAIVERLPTLGVPDAYLVAGCLFQTVWNLREGRELTAGIDDYDVFYFDDADLSYEAEDAVIARAKSLFADLGVRVEVRNQARVHLWYPARFGGVYPRLTSARDGIDRFLVACTRVGIGTPRPNELELYAPDSLEDLYAGILRPNPAMPSPALFAAKAASYIARWPFLTLV